MSTVEGMPWRYAPFFSRIGEVWDLSEPEVAGLLERAAPTSGLALCSTSGHRRS